jgi:flagellin FlaB
LRRWEEMRGKRRMDRGIVKDRRGFTGLEAAIVLTAFIVVAAVFSYMVLGAGFFSTEKAKEVVHTGVEQATSSAELAGDVIGMDTDDNDFIEKINFTIQLTAGQSPLDLNEATISFTNKTIHNESVTWVYTVYNGDTDNLLEVGEKAEIQVNLTNVSSGVLGLNKYNKFQLEFKPKAGGTLPIVKTMPGAIDKTTILY